MLSKITLVAVLAAVGATASNLALPALLARHEPHSLVTRQITASQIPSACQSQCTAALTIYQACTTGDTATCVSVCQPSNYSGFVGCFQCVLNNTPGVTAAETSALNTIISGLADSCRAAGTPVSATSFAPATGSASGTATTSGSAGAVSQSSATTTSVSRTTSLTATGVVNSASSALSSAAAATSSRAAGQVGAGLPQGLQAVVLGLVGVGAGAAMVL